MCFQRAISVDCKVVCTKVNFALESMTKVSRSENIHVSKKEYVTVKE